MKSPIKMQYVSINKWASSKSFSVNKMHFNNVYSYFYSACLQNSFNDTWLDLSIFCFDKDALCIEFEMSDILLQGIDHSRRTNKNTIKLSKDNDILQD